MKIEDKYSDSINRLGQMGILGAIAFMLGIPTIICAVYDIFPNFITVAKSSIGMFALFTPILVSEVFSYTPMLGSASYITFITGNIMNLKLPCALNSMNIAGVAQGTEEGDAVATFAVAVSSILTTLIIILGLILLVPLQPVLQMPAVQTATTYILPALFGGLALSMVAGDTGGDYVIKGKLLAGVLPFIIIFVLNMFIPIRGLEGVAILVMIPVTLFSAKFLYNKGIITVTLKNDSTEEPIS
ncbi:MAG: hypothetical protein HOD17_09925 [Desulfobacteraceae bacterium]|nr:hypothetical protein [Desulfobacteraceae bacterium]